ncbi:MAG TPA: alpha/beta fold hydrolase, partial [Candidatus Eisenbacteria bacterium]
MIRIMKARWRSRATGLLLAAAALSAAGRNVQAETTTTDRFGIDRYLNIRAAANPRLSPDDRYVAFLTNITGTNQVWRVPVEGGWPEQLTAYSEPISGFTYSPVDNRIVFLRATGGSEQDQIYLLSADGADITPLVVEDGVTHYFGGWSWDGTKILYTSNLRDKAIFDPYLLDLATMKSTRLAEETTSMFAAGFSPKDDMVLLRRQNTNIDIDIFMQPLKGGERVLLTKHEGEANFSGGQWAKDQSAIFVTSNKDREFLAPARLEIPSAKLTWLDDTKWDIEGVNFSFDGTHLARTDNVDGQSRLSLFDGGFGGRAMAAPELPPGLYSAPQFSRDNELVVFAYQTSTRPNDIYTWRPATKTLNRITFSNLSGIPPESFVQPELVRFESFDGLSVPAYIYMPTNMEPGTKPPCLVMMHGGPESQERPDFAGTWQYFLQRGYAILAPNVRGSSGYGKTYLHLDDIEKREDSVKDMAAAVEWLKKQGRIDPDRVAVMGGSYGGYMVLAGLTLYPELFQAGIDLVGIANFTTFLEKTSSYRRYWREVEYGFLEK